MVRPEPDLMERRVVYDVPMSKSGVGISSFWLKVTAIVAMTCNHVANVFASTIPTAAMGLYPLGGITFPIMAFLLVEGYHYTSNVRRYALRLAAFAVVSQVPYSLLWGAVPNVLFTLLVSLGVLVAHDRIPSQPLFALIAGMATLATLPFDWGLVGVLTVLLFHRLRHHPHGVPMALAVPFLAIGLPPALAIVSHGPDAVGALSMLTADPFAAAAPSFSATNTIDDLGALPALWATVFFALVGFFFGSALITRYDGRRGRPMKWFFYAYYPGHLAVIWLMSMLII